jgi:type I restriction enzyme R subunit
VIPALQAAGWDREPARICEQVTFTDGRIVVVGQQARRRPGKRADFVLRYRADMPLATVEAKLDGAPVGEGMQQSKDYVKRLVEHLRTEEKTSGAQVVDLHSRLRTESRTRA